MPATTVTRPRRGLLVPTLATLAAFILLLALGTWQLERRAWKEAVIAALSERLALPPEPLPPETGWSALAQGEAEFRRVTFTATLLNDREALVYTNGSAFRPDVAGHGYWVMTPARLADGGLVIVDRGFVPDARKDPATRSAGAVAGPVAITGALRWPDLRGWFTPADDPARNLWFVRDPGAMAAAKGIGPVAPFYVEQEQPVPPGGLPQPGRLAVGLPNNHLQYAITWYGLAVVLVGVFAAFAYGQRNAAREQ
jgi:surfeit locus 1 family protein